MMLERVTLQDRPLAQLWQELHSSPEGLSARETRSRFERYGYNELRPEAWNMRRALVVATALGVPRPTKRARGSRPRPSAI